VATAPPATTSVATAPPAGAYVDDPAIVVGSAPPAPRSEVASPGPAGCAWVRGHWAWRGQWVWVAGAWQKVPVGRHQWAQGAWVQQGTSWSWQPGYWL
jgi:hypothetical protein